MPSPIPKARYKAPQEIVERIDLKKAEVVRLRKTAENLEAKARAVYRKHPQNIDEPVKEELREKLQQADAWLESAELKRKKADHIEGSYMNRLKGKLRTICTALLPFENNTDQSIPK